MDKSVVIPFLFSLSRLFNLGSENPPSLAYTIGQSSKLGSVRQKTSVNPAIRPSVLGRV